MTVVEGELLWTPSEEFAQGANVTKLMAWLGQNRGLEFTDYAALWHWSVTETEAFWGALWDYFEIISDSPYEQVIDNLEMKPGGRWFPGSRVNFTEHVLRMERPGEPALFHLSETRPLTAVNWDELGRQVRIMATQLRTMGIKPGDPVCAIMPNIPETAMLMLAVISVGAVWSVAAPEFGESTILDRFSQIKPKMLFVADGYRFGGKDFDRRGPIRNIVGELQDSLEQVVYLPYLMPQQREPCVDAVLWDTLMAADDPGADNFRFERVACDHPMWILFSSGTTGLPKAIVHGHVGALMELLKVHNFHINLKPGDVGFFYTTSGWMMFNYVVSMLLTGATGVLYDGNPAYPTPDVLWKMAADTGTTSFGASPTYVQALQNLGLEPGKTYDLSALTGIVVGGAPSTPETFEWFYNSVKSDLWVTSQSGGTELTSGLVGATPTQPVYAGEIQTRCLGMNVDSWSDDGASLVDEVGELVCKTPFPSMPLYFLNDTDDARYRASYFEDFPGVWRHGDFIRINDRGGCYIYGRSDSTLNRHGVRIGTAEIYRTVDNLPEIADSLVVCIELPGGDYFMPLFVNLTEGQTLDDELVKMIAGKLRSQCSPRHVPDKIVEIEAVPYTLTGKKMEVPVRKLLMGWPLEKAASRDAMGNPEAIEFFIDYVATTDDYSLQG